MPASSVSLAHTELTLKAQEQALETRQAQLFHGVFSTLDEDWWKAFFLVIYTEWKDYSEFAEKYFPPHETELGRADHIVGTTFEYLGVLVKEGLVSIRLIALLVSYPPIIYWKKFEPII